MGNELPHCASKSAASHCVSANKDCLLGWLKHRGTLTVEKGLCAITRPSSLMGNFTSQDATMFWILKSCRGTEDFGQHPNFNVG